GRVVQLNAAAERLLAVRRPSGGQTLRDELRPVVEAALERGGGHPEAYEQTIGSRALGGQVRIVTLPVFCGRRPIRACVVRRLGRFELADGGTIFLDEVGDLPSDTQLALLRVLQEREFERVGGNRSIRVDVRVIAATNRDLNAAMGTGAFRSDLFYRLNVFPIEMPALRERQEDIPLLVAYFVDRYARKAGKTIENIDERTFEILQGY